MPKARITYIMRYGIGDGTFVIHDLGRCVMLIHPKLDTELERKWSYVTTVSQPVTTNVIQFSRGEYDFFRFGFEFGSNLFIQTAFGRHNINSNYVFLLICFACFCGEIKSLL